MQALYPTRAGPLETFALHAELVRGSGCDLFDADGRQYLDFLAQYGALPFGHNPPEIWSALNEMPQRQAPS